MCKYTNKHSLCNNKVDFLKNPIVSILGQLDMAICLEDDKHKSLLPIWTEMGWLGKLSQYLAVQ